MKIPVFISCPTKLSKKQHAIKVRIYEILDSFGLQAENIGAENYPAKNPMTEVLILAKHCAGGIILGFKQYEFENGKRYGTRSYIDKVFIPTPWNHLEAGVLYGLRLPLLIFREDGINGGIFDPGVTENYIHNMPIGKDFENEDSGKKLRDLINTFAIEVRENFRSK